MKYKDSVIKTCSAGASTASKKKRGEILFDLDFVNTMEEELKEMNKRRMKSNEKLTLIGDAAYDARENFNMLAESGHRPLFKVCSNYSSISRASPARRRGGSREMRTGARELATQNAGVWKLCFLKRVFGEKHSSRKPAYVVRELLIMVSFQHVSVSIILFYSLCALLLLLKIDFAAYSSVLHSSLLLHSFSYATKQRRYIFI